MRRPGPGESKPEGCRKIWVGWFSKRPEEDEITDLFKDCGDVTDVRISEHQHRGHFAHVQFEDTNSVDLAMKKQGDAFMDRRLEIDYAYMDKVMLNPQREANTPGRILRCKPRTSKPPNGHTLWIGDISIDTSEQDVIDFFAPCGEIELICLKVNQLRNGHFGHVKFFDTDAVDKAVELAGQLLKGFPVRMDYAEDKPIEAYRKDTGPVIKRRPPDCHTIWVGGIGRDSTEDTIRQTFEKCGPIREVRWNPGAQFCHVQFVDGDAVDQAMKLTGTTMLGSKMRVDFADDRRNAGMPLRPGSPGRDDIPPLGLPPATWQGPGGQPPPDAWLGPPGGLPPPGAPLMPFPGGPLPPPGGPPPPWFPGPPPPDGRGPPPPPWGDPYYGWPPPPGWGPGPPPPGYGGPGGYPPPPGAPYGAGPAPPPGYPGPGGYALPPPPGTAPAPPANGPQRGRSPSCGSSYSYSYSYTPSPERAAAADGEKRK